MKCLTGKCDRIVSAFEISEENAIIPAECEIEELRRLFSFFQYKAPNIDSLKSPMLDTTYHQSVLDEIMKGHGEYFFCDQNAKTEDELSRIALNGVRVCAWCKRFLCKRMTKPAKRDRSRRETDLECLLRHLRNAIAHGHVFVLMNKNYNSVLFEDLNDKKNTTARVVCCQADLRSWKKKLEEAVARQTELNGNTIAFEG